MLTTIITAILALLTEIAPAVSTASVVAKIIANLVALLPAIVQEAKDLAPTVKNIIATLRGNAATTPEQLDQLDAIEAPIDAAFDAAATAALAEDAAAEKTGGV
jgi:hypothetical protein